jgi:hypothetical protein
MKKLRLLLSAAFIGFLLILNPARAQKFNFLETEVGILLKYNRQNIFFYQAATKSQNNLYPRANYVHPLYGLEGEILTEDFPEDHLHHRGIFWAWHQLYVENHRAGDGWECKGISWKIQDMGYKAYADYAVLKIRLTWEGDISGTTTGLVNEETLITCRKSAVDQLEIDFDIRLTALHQGTRIGGSEDNKGYSGFSIRTKLPGDIQFFSSTGKVTPIETAIQAGGWISMQGTFNPGQKKQTALTIMCNPDDPIPFHGWILRNKGSMQNAAFPGSDPVAIPINEPLRMRYRILLHRPDLGWDQIASNYYQFLNQPD